MPRKSLLSCLSLVGFPIPARRIDLSFSRGMVPSQSRLSPIESGMSTKKSYAFEASLEKLESLGTKPSTQTLCLLRQLKYVESVMLKGKSVYSRREVEENDSPNTADVEMVLLDLL